MLRSTLVWPAPPVTLAFQGVTLSFSSRAVLAGNKCQEHLFGPPTKRLRQGYRPHQAHDISNKSQERLFGLKKSACGRDTGLTKLITCPKILGTPLWAKKKGLRQAYRPHQA